jgi:VIT1/CCC1 family predicted Fe2+/Mn2+ transporter
LSTETQTIAPARGGDGGDPALADQSIAELLRRLSDQSSMLVRQELDLAKAELAAKGKQAGIGAGMFGAAAVFGLYAVGALTACLILALSLALAGWLAALIVTVVYAAVAGGLALAGKAKIQKGVPPVPERTVESVKADVQMTKQRAKDGRR